MQYSIVLRSMRSTVITGVGHTDAAEFVPIPTTAVVPKAADKGETVVKKLTGKSPERRSIRPLARAGQPSHLRARVRTHVDPALPIQVLEPSPSTLVIILYHQSYMDS